MLVESVHWISFSFFAEPKDKSERFYGHSSCRTIINSTSGIATLLRAFFMQDYHQLDIWNRAMDYAVAVYQFLPSLPEEEKYNLASQLRRAVTSAPLNIAEGCGAASNTEFGRFLGFTYRSLKEVVTALGTL
jgi:hypothetical protein